MPCCVGHPPGPVSDWIRQAESLRRPDLPEVLRGSFPDLCKTLGAVGMGERKGARLHVIGLLIRLWREPAFETRG